MINRGHSLHRIKERKNRTDYSGCNRCHHERKPYQHSETLHHSEIKRQKLKDCDRDNHKRDQ